MTVATARACLLVFLLAASASLSALAHQAKAAITEILFNPRTGNLEVAHRFIAHDAEHAVRLLFGSEADIIGSQRTRAHFAAYVADHFSLKTDGRPLDLTLLGSDLDRGFIWVYQEVSAPWTGQSLTVQHRALSALWPDQINTVNVKRDGKVQTIRFRGQQEPGTVRF